MTRREKMLIMQRSRARLLVHDTFTDTNGVLLENHTPDTKPTGAVWAKLAAGVIDIQTNQASRASGSAYYSIQTNKADVTLSAVLTCANSSCNPGIVFRDSSAAQLNLFMAYLDDAGNTIKILQYINGALTIPYSAALAITTGTPYAVEVRLSGSSIKVYVDGVMKLDVTDTDHLTATKHGIGILGAAGTIDDFQITG